MGGHPSQDEASFDRSPSELRNLESTNAETLFCKVRYDNRSNFFDSRCVAQISVTRKVRTGVDERIYYG